MSRRFATALTASIAATTLLLAACGGGDASPSPSTATPTAPAGGSNGGGSGEVREVEVLMYDNYFEPTEIRMAVGETVEVNAKNEGVAIHNMRVLSHDAEGQDFASDHIVNPGDDSEFEMRFTKAGTYQFQCDFHLPGMVGEVIVE